MAAGDWLADFSPQCNEPPLAHAATPDRRNGHPVLDFDDSTDEAAVFTGFMPWHYGGGGITVYAVASFTSDANPAHAARLDVAIERIGDGVQNLDSDGYAAPKPLVVAVPATSGYVEVGSVTFADGAEIDHLRAGELFRIRVECDAAQSDFVGDFELLRLVVRETP